MLIGSSRFFNFFNCFQVSRIQEFVSLSKSEPKQCIVVLFLNACVLLAIDTEGQNEE